MSVDTRRDEYIEQSPDVEKNRTAVAGERAIKAGTTKFLPPLASQCIYTTTDEDGNQLITPTSQLTPEGQASYRKYLSMAYFFGASGRTVDGLTGLIFSKEINKSFPAVIDYLNDNVDGSGTSLRTQASAAVNEAFISPRSALLVDFPNVQERLSVADSERQNLRPKILHYKFEAIINWHHEVINNEQKLTLVVLRERIRERSGQDKFVFQNKTIYRVLELIEGTYHQTVYEDGEQQSEPMQVLVNGLPSQEIPFYFIEVGADGKSVINDLVDTNLNHYRFFADYAAKEHASCFPVFTESGAEANDKNIVIGPGAKWSNSSPEATFSILQSQSDGGSINKYLLDQEQRMAALGAEMLKPRIAQAESAEAKSLDQVAQNSTTAMVANAVSNAYKRAIQFCALWLGSSEEVTFALNTDYNPTGLSPQAQLALFTQMQGGAISYQTYFQALQRGEVIQGDVKMEEEQARIAADNIGMDV